MGHRDNESLFWVGTRTCPLRAHRRKAAVEVSLPGSSHSSLSAGDPEETVGLSTQRRLRSDCCPWLVKIGPAMNDGLLSRAVVQTD